MSISTLALTIRWSMPISTLVMTSQFCTIFRSEDSMKSISEFGFWSHLLELPMSSTCLLLWRKVSLLLLGCFLQQNPAVFPLSHFCYLFQRALCISFCHLCSSLQFWCWSRPLLCGGCYIYILPKSKIRILNLNSFKSSNFIPISWDMCENMNPTGFVFCWPFQPLPRSRPLEMVQNGRGQCFLKKNI